MSLITLLISFAFLMVIGTPIAFAMGISSFLVLFSSGIVPLVVIPQRIIIALDSFPLLAVPLFVLTGEIMNVTGITTRLIDLANALIGHVAGGLSYVNVLASMFFAGVSGSSTADAAGIGRILVPAMINEGYDEDISLSVTAASATIGPIIPPSITMVIYSSMTGLSIGRLFLAGIIPGILFGISQMIVCWCYTIKRHYPQKKRKSIKEVQQAFVGAILPLFTPIIVLFGIVGGMFTATEAGAIAVVYSLILGVLYKKITIKGIYDALLETGLRSSIVLLIIAFSSIFGWILAIEQFPLVIVNYLTLISSDPTIIYLLIILGFLIVGMFLEGLAAMIILVPALVPIASRFGFEPLHFALIIILCLAIGGITPPVGILLFTTCGVNNLPLKKVGNIIWVFAFAMLLVVLLVTFFPSLITFIPNKFM